LVRTVREPVCDTAVINDYINGRTSLTLKGRMTIITIPIFGPGSLKAALVMCFARLLHKQTASGHAVSFVRSRGGHSVNLVPVGSLLKATCLPLIRFILRTHPLLAKGTFR